MVATCAACGHAEHDHSQRSVATYADRTDVLMTICRGNRPNLCNCTGFAPREEPTMTDTTPDRKGKRYESKDDPGRVVRVIGRAPAEYAGDMRVRWRVESIANPRNPFAVGRKTSVHEQTIARRYTELSH